MAFKPETCLKFRALQNGCTIRLNPSAVDGNHYSFTKNGTNWVDDYISLNNGEWAYVMGNSYPSKSLSENVKFIITGDYEIVSGSIMSLVDGGAGEQTSIGKEYGFYNLFSDTKLKSIPAELLPATELATGCYDNMFSDCISLATIPANLLPATELTERCYYRMFIRCDSLTAIPVLPATELADYCYNAMFAGCINLTTVPEGAFMAKRFAGSSCPLMFRGCSALNEIHVNFTEWPTDPEDPLDMWVDGVAVNGDFYCSPNLSEARGTNRIPEKWTIHKSKPKNKLRGSFNFGKLRASIG